MFQEYRKELKIIFNNLGALVSDTKYIKYTKSRYMFLSNITLLLLINILKMPIEMH